MLDDNGLLYVLYTSTGNMTILRYLEVSTRAVLIPTYCGLKIRLFWYGLHTQNVFDTNNLMQASNTWNSYVQTPCTKYWYALSFFLQVVSFSYQYNNINIIHSYYPINAPLSFDALLSSLIQLSSNQHQVLFICVQRFRKLEWNLEQWTSFKYMYSSVTGYIFWNLKKWVLSWLWVKILKVLLPSFEAAFVYMYFSVFRHNFWNVKKECYFWLWWK